MSIQKICVLHSAGQSSDVLVRFRETVAVKSQAESLQLDRGKTRSRQKVRGHRVSKTKTWRDEMLKIDVAKTSGLENSSNVENVVFSEQYSRARAHPTLAVERTQKLRNAVKLLTQTPSGLSPVVLSPEFVERKRTNCQTNTLITTKLPPHTPVPSDTSKIQKTGRTSVSVCLDCWMNKVMLYCLVLLL